MEQISLVFIRFESVFYILLKHLITHPVFGVMEENAPLKRLPFESGKHATH
jgi:hypothetical protein